MKENKKTSDQVVIVRKGVTRGYTRAKTGKIKITPTPKEGKLDPETRKVFRQLAELILLLATATFLSSWGGGDEEKSL